MKLRTGAICTLALSLAASPALGGPTRQYVRARLDVGYDSNLLDASDAERSAFASHDPNSFFVVNSMDDMFLDGELGAQWRLSHGGARPALGLRYERKQYLRNPIRSENRFTLGSNVRPFSNTRLDLGLDYTPETYARHRADVDALPGEPVFRAEVYRKTQGDFQVTQSVSKATSIGLGAEGEFRDDKAPFDARDRWLAGGNLGVSQAIPGHLWIQGVGGYRRTWSRNEPGVPTDLSNREWFVRPALGGNLNPLRSTFKLEVELAWRDYTSPDPADANHFGRRDQRGELVFELSRSIAGVGSETRLSHTWWSSNIPDATQDDNAYIDTEIRTGLVWTWDRAKKSEP